MISPHEQTPIDGVTALASLREGKELAEMRNLSREAIDFIYAYSALHYRRGDYDIACSGFRFLCAHKHRDPDMWLALARCCTAMKEDSAARRAFLVAFSQRPSPGLGIDLARAYIAASAFPEADKFIQAARALITHENSATLRHDLDALEAQLATAGSA